LILLAFFFPLAVYLLVLGILNRHRHPLLVSGVWDGIGLLFGVSGFLFFAGPAILSALSERWRWFWLLGKSGVSFAGSEGSWPAWAFLAFLYVLLIVGGAALYLWRQLRFTAIYNSKTDLVERTLTDTCKELGINPMRSGNLFLFGPPAEGQEQRTVLEVESFPLMSHVTLRWEPADSSLRRSVETELGRRLAETISDEGLRGAWLLSLGFILLSFDLAGAFFLVLLHLRSFVR
jgi:hypothetical protein